MSTTTTKKKTTRKPSKSVLLPLSITSTPLVWVTTTEEYRFLAYEREVLLRKKDTCSQVYVYSALGEVTESVISDPSGSTSGGRKAAFDNARKVIDWFVRSAPDKHVSNSNVSLDQDYAPARSVLMMFDVAFHLQHPGGSKHSNALLTRVIKSNQDALIEDQKMIVIVSHTGDVPKELEHSVVTAEHALPDADELARLVVRACNYFQCDDESEKFVIQQKDLDVIVGMLTGMQLSKADNIIAQSVNINNQKRAEDPSSPIEFDLETIRQARVESVRNNSTLEIVTPIGGLDQVGGHEALKKYIRSRRQDFTREARDEGISNPKGILLCGISGTGKTLLCGCMAAEWGCTILRGDVGACKGSLVGQSEAAFRKMLKDAEDQASDMSPVVLQLDEAGKMFGGGLRGGSLDSGVSSGMSAIFLTWRQECKKPVFVVMTCNEDVQNFPMEWLRPGRIDAVFFQDVPDKKGREEVLTIHLNRRNWLSDVIDIPTLADASEGLTPAEIELAVENGIRIKRDEVGPRPAALTTEHVLKALSEIKPITKTNAKEIGALREWAAERGYVHSVTDGKDQSESTKKTPGRRRVGSAIAAAAAGSDS